MERRSVEGEVGHARLDADRGGTVTELTTPGSVGTAVLLLDLRDEAPIESPRTSTGPGRHPAERPAPREAFARTGHDLQRRCGSPAPEMQPVAMEPSGS